MPIRVHNDVSGPPRNRNEEQIAALQQRLDECAAAQADTSEPDWSAIWRLRLAVEAALNESCPAGSCTAMNYGFGAVDAIIAAAQADTAPGDAPPAAADLARWLQEAIESQPAITIRRGVEPQVAWRALADELLRRWGR